MDNSDRKLWKLGQAFYITVVALVLSERRVCSHALILLRISALLLKKAFRNLLVSKKLHNSLGIVIVLGRQTFLG